MRFSIMVFSTLMVATVSHALAEPYVGIGIGSASFDVDLSALGAGEFDDNATANKLYIGYAFNQYIAAEAAVYNFAEASVGALETSPGSGNFLSAEASMKGVAAYIAGSYPLTKSFSMTLKAGVLNWDSELSINTGSVTNDGTDAAYALAASYAFSKQLLMTVEWEDFNTGNPQVSMLSVGFRFNFR